MVNTFRNYKRIRNKGAALVTVIIAAFFVTIITTLLLFVAVRTYKSRQIDYQSKQNFYQAEKTLDELKAILIQDTSECCKTAYVAVLNDYMNLTPAERQSSYYENFIDLENEIWSVRVTKEVADGIRALLDEEEAECIESAGEIKYYENEGYILFKDIVVSCTTIEGYYSRIKTDIRVDAPKIDWANGAGNQEMRTIDMSEYVAYSNWQRD